nr:hypothetical protein [Spirochaetaceae bacterium]
MINFVNPNDDLSLELVYSGLELYDKSMISALQKLLPESFLDIDPEDTDKKIYRTHKLQKILNGYRLHTPKSDFIIYFIFNSDVRELCGSDYIEKLLNQIDWAEVLSSNSFFSYIGNISTNSIMFMTLLTTNKNERLFNCISQLPFPDKIYLFRKLERHAKVKPYISASLLFSLENYQSTLCNFGLYNYWIFDLPTEQRDIIFSMAEQIDKTPSLIFDIKKSDKNLHHLLLPYCSEKYKTLLEEIYKDSTLYEIIADIHGFLKSKEDRDWFEPGFENIEELLPTPRYEDHYDGIDGFIDNVEETILSFLLEKIKEADKSLIYDFFLIVLKSDFRVWDILNDIFYESEVSEDIYNELTDYLVETAREKEFIDLLYSELEAIKVNVSPSFVPPQIFELFLDKLLSNLVMNYDSHNNILILLSLNIIYSGPMSNGPYSRWENYDYSQIFSRLFLSILTTESQEYINGFF